MHGVMKFRKQHEFQSIALSGEESRLGQIIIPLWYDLITNIGLNMKSYKALHKRWKLQDFLSTLMVSFTLGGLC